MRLLVVLLAAVLLGGTIWLLAGPGATPTSRPRLTDEGGDPDAPPELRHRVGTLLFRVRAPDGSVPAGAEVGYETPAQPRYYYVDAATGTRTLSDVPLGEVMLLARAPGYQPVRRPSRITGGLLEEVLIHLVPAPLGPNGPNPPSR